MRRLHHVNGTKERPRGRECLTFSLARYGPVIVDRVHPDDRDEMFSRLWGHYGKGSVWVEYRRMGRHEQYATMDAPIISAKLAEKDALVISTESVEIEAA